MSIYEPEDIARWEAKQMTMELFEVKLLKIPVFDDAGAEIREDEQYTVCNKHVGSHSYPCYDERTAKELCEYLNSLTADLMLEQKLPAPLELENIISDFEPLAKLLNEKQSKLEELRTAINHELVCELDYLHESNQIKLDHNKIKEDLELSKMPTEKQINAYAEENLTHEYDLWKIAKANTSLIKQQLDLINDRISFEKYVLRLKE